MVSEIANYNIIRELKTPTEKPEIKLTPGVGSIQNKTLFAAVKERYGVTFAGNAEAYKHALLMKQSVMHEILNNTIGTMVLTQETTRTKIASFSLISTDKQSVQSMRWAHQNS